LLPNDGILDDRIAEVINDRGDREHATEPLVQGLLGRHSGSSWDSGGRVHQYISVAPGHWRVMTGCHATGTGSATARRASLLRRCAARISWRIGIWPSAPRPHVNSVGVAPVATPRYFLANWNLAERAQPPVDSVGPDAWPSVLSPFLIPWRMTPRRETVPGRRRARVSNTPATARRFCVARTRSPASAVAAWRWAPTCQEGSGELRDDRDERSLDTPRLITLKPTDRSVRSTSPAKGKPSMSTPLRRGESSSMP